MPEQTSTTEFGVVLRRLAQERSIDEQDLVDAIAQTGFDGDPQGVVDGTVLPESMAAVTAAVWRLGLGSEAEREPLIRALVRDMRY